MRHAARPSRRPSTLRRGTRALFTGLVSLTLVMGGSASIATPNTTTAPDAAEIEAQLRAAIEGDTDLTEETGAVGGDADATNPVEEAPAEDAPAAEAPAPEPATETDAAETATDEATAGDLQSGETDDAPSPTAETDVAPEATADADFGILNVPPGDPGNNQAKLIVRAGGDRTGTGNQTQTVSPLAGVTYDFYRTNDTAISGGVLVGSCTTNAAGECGIFASFGGGQGSRSFYAVATGAPDGWRAPSSWSTGDNYRFSTGQISRNASAADRTVTLPTPFNSTVTAPTWANVRDNNPLPPQCGIDLAVVIDLSNSVTRPDPPIPGLFDQYKAAGNDFIDALTGTPSRVALHTFATNAPADGATNGSHALTSVATPTSASALKARINGFAATLDDQDGGTNWDRGFHQITEAGEIYDVVMFLTDGQPTFHRDGEGLGFVGSIREVNEAIHSANAVKALPNEPAVLAVGIGPDAAAPQAANRLSLISGPLEGTDFFRTEFDQLAQTLRAIATANCGGTLSVVKQIVDDAGTVVDETPGGWEFTATTAGNHLEDGASLTDELVRTTDDDTGAVNFGVVFDEPFDPRAVTVTETAQPEFELVQQNGQNAVCTAGGAPVAVTNDGPLGFSVNVGTTDVVTCTVHNREVPPDYDDLVVSKTVVPSFDRDYDWAIDKVAREDRIEIPFEPGAEATFTYDVAVTPSAPVDSGFAVAGTITVTNPNDVPVSGVTVEDALDLPGATCTEIGGTGITITPGGSYEVSYSCVVPDGTATTTGTNTATATWDASAYPGTSGSASTEVDVDFADAQPRVTDGVVVVTDSEIDLADYGDGTQEGNIVRAEDGPAVFTYEITWPGTAGQCVDFPNTASIENAMGTNSINGGGFGIFAVGESSTEVVTLCTGLDLDVEKNVVHSFDRTYLWTIDKVADETVVTADPVTGIATFDYTVTATPVLPPNGWTDSAWAMSGSITVDNPNEWLDITADITDTVDIGGGAICTVDGGTTATVLVAAGQSVTLAYLCTFTSQPGYSGTNTATASWADTLPTPSTSAFGTAEVAADEWSVTPVNDVIDVMDDKTDPANPVDLGTATWNDTGTPIPFEYSVDQQGVPGQCVDFTNTAWIVQTGQEAEEVVTACLEAPLEVDKTAVAAFDRTYLWGIEKDVDQTSVTVDPDTGEAEFAYTVEAIPGGFVDSNWSLRGEIVVTNPNDFQPATVTVTDAVDIGGGAVCTVVDGEDVEIAAGATVVFDYSCTFTGQPSYTGLNTATVESGGEEFTATAAVEFDLDNETDETVDVVDDQTDPANPATLGEATWNAAGTAIPFPYTLTHEGVPGQCVTFTNTAWVVVTGDDPTDDQTVEVCIEAPIQVEKDADASFDRLYEWDIDKSVDDTDVEVDENGRATYTYTVDAVADGFTDSGWEMTGTITVHNPNEYDDGAITVEVVDVTDVGAVCTVDGGTDLTLAPGATEVLDYSCTFDEEPEYEGSNTATVSWTNADGDTDEVSHTVPVEFTADVVTDLTIEVWDDKTDPANPVFLGEATWTEPGSHEFTYEVTHQGVGGQCLEFTNTAWLELASGTGPNDSTTVELCLDSPLTHDKVVDSVEQLPSGDWRVSYEIQVVNDSPYEAVYDLSDTLEFGDGITPLSAIWLLDGPIVGGAWTDLPDETTAVLATDRPIAAGDTHVYVVTVTADVAEFVIGSEAGQCSGDEGTDGGGFLNAATLTSGELEVTERACAEPAAPTIDKTYESLTENADGTWDVVYDLVAGNPNDVTVFYDLVDEPGFARGVVIEGASVVNTAPGDIVTNPGFDAVTDVEVVSGQELAAASSHTYRVTVTVDLSGMSATDETDSRSCGEGALHGLFNEARLTSGNDEYSDEDCVGIPDPTITHAKTAVGTGQNVDGSWTVTYDVVVTNDSSIGGRYDLTDTIEFGAGIMPISAAWTLDEPALSGVWADPATEPTTELAADRPLAGGQSHTYRVTVQADVAAGVIGSEAGQCSGDEGIDGGGFLNAATLSAYGDPQTDRDCLEPAAPTIEKTYESLTENTDDGTWDVVYTLDVANPHDVTLAYDLVDEPAFAAGVVIEDATVVNTAPGDIVTNADFDAVTDFEVVTGQVLPADTTHTYTVTVTVDLTGMTATDESDDRRCGVNGTSAGQGLYNEATITSGNDEYSDEACIAIPDPELDVEKTGTSAIQNPDGSWTVTYEVVATNTSSVGGVYDLADTIEFGDGITPTAATWSLRDSALDGSWENLPDEPTAVLAVDRPLAGGASHTYVVVVQATVEEGVIGSEAGQCEVDDYFDGGGFLNSVTLTAHGEESTDEACLEPDLPDLEKEFGSAVQLEGATWGVTYTLEVDNSGNDSRAFYDLADVPHFAEGVTILGQSVLDVSDPANPVSIDWDGESLIVEGAEVAAGDVHRYEVTFDVRVSAGIPADALECEPGEPGRGFFNSATLTSGPDELEDEDCGDITESVVPNVDKSVADDSPALNDDGTWTIVYDVVVTTPEANTLAAVYELSDELVFGEGITVLGATIVAGNDDTPEPLGSWTGLPPNTAVTDGEVVLPAGVSHVYTVTVDAEVADGVVGSEAGECYTGEVPQAGGFLNTVTLTTDGVERYDDACAEPGPSPWTLSKVSDPVSGSEVDPGDVITYTLTATPTGEYPPMGVVVRDDLSEVLEHAEGYGNIVASTGTTSWDGDVLVWDIGTLAETATLTYSVIVDDDAWDVTLVNVATGSGSTPPTCVDECSTTHTTPPRPTPPLPPTGASVQGVLVVVVLLGLGGLLLTSLRRRRMT